MSVLFPSCTKFCMDRKEIYQQLLACGSGRWLYFMDCQQMPGGCDSIHINNEICFNTAPEMLCDLRGVTLLAPVMLMAMIQSTLV